MRKPSSFWQFTHLLRSMRSPIRSKQPSARRLSCEHLETRNLLAADGWFNVNQPADVNADGVVTPIDALLVANVVYENSGESVTLTADNPGSIYPDVNNDGEIGESDFTEIANQVGGGSGSDAGSGNALQANEATTPVAAVGVGAATMMMSMSASGSGDGEGGGNVPGTSSVYFGVEVGNASVKEDGGSLDFTITLHGDVPNGATIHYMSGSGTATTSSAAGDTNTPYSPPKDYVWIQGTVVLAADGDTAIVSVPVLDDVWVESNETVTLTIDSVTNDTSPIDGVSHQYDSQNSVLLGIGTIVDDDTAFATLAPHQNVGAKEGTVADHWNRTFKAQLSNPVDAEVTVGLTVAPGTATGADYSVPANQVIKFGVGDTVSNLFQVNITNDLIIELNEDYTVTLGSVSGGRDVRLDPDSAKLSVTDTIVNDDSGTINIVPSWVATKAETTADALEGEWGAKYFRLILRHDEFPSDSRVAIDIPVDVKWRAVNGSAKIGGSGPGSNDYAGGTVVYSSGQTAMGSEGTVTGGAYAFGSLPIAILDDSVAEPDESFGIELVQIVWPENIEARAVSLGSSSTNVMIRGDDYATLSITGGGLTTEGDSGFTDTAFSVSLVGAIDRDISVSVVDIPGDGNGGAQATPGTSGDYLLLPASTSISFAAVGATTQAGTVRIYGDTDDEADEEYFRILLSGISDNGLGPFIGIDSNADYIVGGVSDDDWPWPF